MSNLPDLSARYGAKYKPEGFSYIFFIKLVVSFKMKYSLLIAIREQLTVTTVLLLLENLCCGQASYVISNDTLVVCEYSFSSIIT